MTKQSRSEQLDPFEQSLNRAKKAGLKQTPGRQVLLRFFTDLSNLDKSVPLTQEEVQNKLSRKKSRLKTEVKFDSVTLYRNLKSFTEAGILRKTTFGDGVARYELARGSNEVIRRLICTQCKFVKNLESGVLRELEAEIKKWGYSQVQCSIEFTGVCPPCLKKHGEKHDEEQT